MEEKTTKEAKLKLCIENLISVIETAIYAGDWKVDGACDPDIDLIRAKKLINYKTPEPFEP